MLATIIVRDYLFGERWRKVLDKVPNIDASGKPAKLEVLIVVLGALGIITFILGMFGLAFVASETIMGFHT